jgi:hypothetical protein
MNQSAAAARGTFPAGRGGNPFDSPIRLVTDFLVVPPRAEG